MDGGGGGVNILEGGMPNSEDGSYVLIVGCVTVGGGIEAAVGAICTTSG